MKRKRRSKSVGNSCDATGDGRKRKLSGKNVHAKLCDNKMRNDEQLKPISAHRCVCADDSVEKHVRWVVERCLHVGLERHTTEAVGVPLRKLTLCEHASGIDAIGIDLLDEVIPEVGFPKNVGAKKKERGKQKRGSSDDVFVPNEGDDGFHVAKSS